MEENLDHILLDQLHSSRRIGKLIKKLKKIMKDPSLERGERANQLRQNFFENMIEDKSLLNNKSNKKKTKTEDLLDRSPLYYLYRNAVMVTAFSYMYFTSAFQSYFTNYFAKNENEKNNKKS